MSPHKITWSLVRPPEGCSGDYPLGNDVVGHIYCTADSDAPCRQIGPWADEMDPGEMAEDECWATVWIDETGASLLWVGAARSRLLENGPVSVVWDGADRVWAYVGEDVVNTGPETEDGARLDTIECGIIEINHTADDASAMLDAAEQVLAEVRKLSDPGENVAS